MKKLLCAAIFLLFGTTPLLATPPHYVGELFGGGIVIWVDCNPIAEHGLIAALSDQSPAAGETWDQAVADCAAYSAGGFHDWHLPTKDELFKLCCKAKHVPGGVVNGLNETNQSNKLVEYYWSSTALTGTTAYMFFMWNGANSRGNTNTSPHNTLLSARAVRSF
jgi:hypothetical protein